MAEQQLPVWNNGGIEPPANLQQDGWQPGVKPPAQYFDWLFNRAYKCLEELQAITEALETNKANGTDLTTLNNKVTQHLGGSVTDDNGIHGLKIERGIFTPTIYGSTTAGTPVYLNQHGFYTLIEKIVHFDLYLQLNGIGGMTGDVFIGGLPFVSENTTNKIPTFQVTIFGNIDLQAGETTVGGITLPNTTAIRLNASGDNLVVRVLTNANLGAQVYLRISGFYTRN
ncbi:MAG: hypothetical protein ABS935_02970 [Solibacillus sp.]|uniref:hypothetical protein n=1 Tax=Solibacillus sp. TaxID=1909654 RepID=UPI0033148CBD